MEKKTGVLVMAFGGPDSPEAIEPFLTKLMGGRKPAPVILEKVKARYDLIGGFSPLPRITKEQAEALEAKLKTFGDVKVKVGMGYWRPAIEESLEAFAKEGYEKIIAISLSPHYSRVSTGAYFEKLKEAEEKLISQGFKLDIQIADSWYDHPLFIQAIAEHAKAKLKDMENPFVIFSAHSLPLSHIESGDSYVVELEATIDALVEELKPDNWQLAYQSRSPGQGEWLGPEVEEVMNNIAEEGFKEVLVVPVGFAADHIETLYDIDICHRKHAETLGLSFERTSAMNTSPKFIEALLEKVKEKF